jgi:phosphoribosylformimino-5-aminoimidazole carboxamide ribotide isomerase
VFIIYPAIDLRNGQVVRLLEGDPNAQTTYSSDSGDIARRWIDCGATWIHVVNLDGALDQSDSANLRALQHILEETSRCSVKVQYGGGLRSLESIQRVIKMGVDRVVLGTIVVENQRIFQEALSAFSSAQIAVSLDARDGMVRTHGWKSTTRVLAIDLAQDLHTLGLQTLVFTDISRDGKQSGINLEATRQLAKKTTLNVIASGGVRGIRDIISAKNADLAGIIVGKALYENQVDLQKAVSLYQEL